MENETNESVEAFREDSLVDSLESGILSRRNFLKGGAASVAVFAAVGMFGCAPDSGSGSSTTDDSSDAPADNTADGADAGAAGDGGEGGEGGPGGGPGGPGGGNDGPVDRTAAKEAAAADGRVFGYSGPGDWLGEKPSFTVTETIDAEVVVVGLGHSGTQAYLSACETIAEANGGTVDGKVVGVEKQEEDMMSWYGEDMGCFNSQFSLDQGFGAWDLGAITDEFVTRGGGRSYPDIVKAYVENSGPTLDHMIEVAKEMGIDERAYTYNNTPDGWVIMQANMDYDKIAAGTDIYECLNKTNYPLVPGTKTWVGSVQFMGEYNDEPIQGVAANSVLPLVNQACLDKGTALGGELRYGSSAVVLVQNDNGDVTGVIVEEGDTYVQINASKGVILAGGDYCGNADMCWALLNESMERNEREGGLKADFYSFMGGRDGSSVKLGCWAGGFVEPAPRGSMVLGGGIGGPWGANAMLWLNSVGERFTNEGNLTAAQTASARQAEGTGWLVTDAKWMKSVCASGIEHGGPNGGRPQYYQDMIDGMAAIVPGPEGGEVKNCTIAERGYTTVIAANTLEELADYMEVPAEAKETWLASIAHYNELCEAGADTDYGKHASAMIPVNEAPFYGVKGSVGRRSSSPMMVTMSGLMTDKHQNVLNEEYVPIKGLYTCGNSLGGRYGTGYSTPTAGNSIGMADTHGRLAGIEVASL